MKVNQERLAKIGHRQDLDGQIKKLMAERDAIDAEIRLDMENHGAIICQYRNMRLVELQETTRRILDSKRLRIEKPDVAEEYTKESVSRHLHYVS